MKNQQLFFLLVILCFVSPSISVAKTYQITPSDIVNIASFLNRLAPGDSLVFMPGKYVDPVNIKELNGVVNNPIFIHANSNINQPIIIDNQVKPGEGKAKYGFYLEKCSWINISGFNFENCWNENILLENSNYISIIKCQFKKGKRAVFAIEKDSHHILIEKCSWEQDERVWTHAEDYSWEEVHHGVHSHYNGSMYQGWNMSGMVVIRDNTIKNVFNGLRISMIGDGTDTTSSSNIDIYRNTLINTADNAFEPEVWSANVFFYHNKLIDGHAFISLTEVGGGPIYMYGNVGYSQPNCDDGWTIYKLSCETRTFKKPVYIFNNSWWVDYPAFSADAMDRTSKYIKHFNNAYHFYPDSLFIAERFGSQNEFNYDCSNTPFPKEMQDAGFEKNGIVAEPDFIQKEIGDFRLNNNSPCINAGIYDDKLITSYLGKAPDIGAYEGNELIKGISFSFASFPYLKASNELPRITRFYKAKNTIDIYFSLPMD
ncbi:MAG: right-handed parallel beta-helix repeat-containing protein, partial [Bacteroidota bacterium]